MINTNTPKEKWVLSEEILKKVHYKVENNYDTNPYKLKDHGIPPSVLASLHDAALKHLCGDDSLIYPDQNSS
ncbi:hypothetical protein RhiirA5_426647 [Rhizophagus irregularis]|uniref:Uncharacterized protein n=2 Tax=Rhizophagus irregularis TaxID=588596 RepID=A0A2N0P3S4_9GLOM|nr:hypothetical protein GLOIN_2v1766413 [Rhizophagus irregularis DAOM 181602=DAOM 197198]PKC01475.1 hypothetical protein RhiirA5_426647 [Rhizophagus irregularis]PKC55589.1 hypothetical protein RhiirA1_475344 [Rhizophagus irregularis]POG78799.1 hypothetical protein GLOIN_2v1766413 [Rhizophagus irregularis DAOM 181602=DAOM 197198]|eukprot:XP_025185665.1 hypothetical protein GLOIN_2v1766413 [Rhizophagus irregularis DAOM 181602=DAOM 197198]